MLNDILEMRTWPSFLSFQGTTDGVFRAIAVILAGIVIVRYSTLFEEEYTKIDIFGIFLILIGIYMINS